VVGGYSLSLTLSSEQLIFSIDWEFALVLKLIARFVYC